MGRLSGAAFSTVPSQQEGPGLDSWVRGHLCVVSMFSLCPSGFSGILPQSKTCSLGLRLMVTLNYL